MTPQINRNLKKSKFNFRKPSLESAFNNSQILNQLEKCNTFNVEEVSENDESDSDKKKESTNVTSQAKEIHIIRRGRNSPSISGYPFKNSSIELV